MFDTPQKKNEESKALEKIQLKHLIIPFLILGVGCFIALIIFLLEMIVKKKTRKVQQENENNNQNI